MNCQQTDCLISLLTAVNWHLLGHRSCCLLQNVKLRQRLGLLMDVELGEGVVGGEADGGNDFG